MSRLTHSAALADAELEARIRATLHRHADDIEPHQPPWSELVAQAGAVVLPLHGTELRPAHLKSTRRPFFSGPWVRPTLAAAVALAIALSAAVVIQGRVGDPTTPASDNDEPSSIEDLADGPVIPSPGSIDFDKAAATPLPFVNYVDEGVVWMDDPKEVAAAYLRQVGLDAHGVNFVTDPAAVLETFPTDRGDIETAQLWWSVRDEANFDAVLSEGAVFLRRDVLDATQWVVVGAFTQSMVGLSGVRRADGRVSFTVNDYLQDPEVQVGLDGEVLSTDDLRRNITKTYTFPDPAPGEVITIEVQHVAGDLPQSITAMALAPAGAGVPQSTPTTSIPKR